jgi:hypothetical protein
MNWSASDELRYHFYMISYISRSLLESEDPQHHTYSFMQDIVPSYITKEIADAANKVTLRSVI